MFGCKQLSMREEVLCIQTDGHTCFEIKSNFPKSPGQGIFTCASITMKIYFEVYPFPKIVS